MQKKHEVNFEKLDAAILEKLDSKMLLQINKDLWSDGCWKSWGSDNLDAKSWGKCAL